MTKTDVISILVGGLVGGAFVDFVLRKYIDRFTNKINRYFAKKKAKKTGKINDEITPHRP